jgi:porphobilinogen synthase
MPGVIRRSVDKIVEAAREAHDLGIPAICLFPYTDASLKTELCEEAWNPDNLSNRAIRAVKDAVPELAIMTDIALDPYNANGHDGIVRDGVIVNDETVEALVKMALAQAEAGADILGSLGHDGRADRRDPHRAGGGGAHECVDHVLRGEIRVGLLRSVPRCGGRVGRAQGRQEDLPDRPRQPARGAALRGAGPERGRRHGHGQTGPALSRHGARGERPFGAPTYAYQVSGEYAMIEAAAANGWIDGEKVMLESLMCFRRAGCDGVLTYFAPRVARLLNG